MTSAAVKQTITDADRCVKCAVCLPHCPTYGLSGDESESPRGRIALMRALADGSLEPGPGLVRHLDQCLACRNCEPVCPAQVPYGRLIASGRAVLRERRPLGRVKRMALRLVLQRRGLRALTRLARLAQGSGLDRLVPAMRRLPALPAPESWHTGYPATGTPRGRVGLFVGCVADVLDATTRHDCIRVLNAAGYRVALPANQTCCGALHRHAGDAVTASRLVQVNRDAFQGLDTVISTATGCGAELAEQAFSREGHADINAFLAGDEAFRRIELKPLDARIAAFASCTQRNVLGGPEDTLEVLRRIPQAEVVPVSGVRQCCGAAGSYVLEHAKIADRLGSRLARDVTALEPNYLAVANIGCAMHLSDHLKRLGCDIEVVHPVSLLARRLP